MYLRTYHMYVCTYIVPMYRIHTYIGTSTYLPHMYKYLHTYLVCTYICTHTYLPRTYKYLCSSYVQIPTYLPRTYIRTRAYLPCPLI
jgi:hypothetical protein